MNAHANARGTAKDYDAKHIGADATDADLWEWIDRHLTSAVLVAPPGVRSEFTDVAVLLARTFAAKCAAAARNGA